MINLDQVISKQGDLPSAPAVVHQLTTLMGKEDVSNHDLALVVETDQALSARMLKLVNSPFYGFARQVTSVEEAVTMLGHDTLQQLLLATSVVSSLGTNTSALSMDEFWLHSLSVGTLAKHLLRHETVDARNEAFMCGVLHDIGRLLFVRMDPARYSRFQEGGGAAHDMQKEKEWFGADHQEIGQALALKWNFPPSFASAIAHHHCPDEATEAQSLVAAINMADVLAHALDLGKSGCDYVTTFSPHAWQLLKLDRTSLEEIVERAFDEICRTESMIRNIS